jgi:NADH-quinone oxidoreductase subunit J
MTILQIVFIIIAATTLGTGLMVVTTRNLIHAVLWLIASLFGVAILFALLQAGFLAVVQVVIYIGAIAILLIFAVMLTRKIAQDSDPRFNENWMWAAATALIFFAVVVWALVSWPGISSQATPLDPRTDLLKNLGIALVSPDAYVLPFEMASVLLLAALIGSVVVARERK